MPPALNADAAITILRIVVRATAVVAAIFVFITFIGTALSMVAITLNQNMLGDLFAMIQMWAPFNINVVLVWFVTALTAYFAYKMALMVLIWINRLIE